MDLCGNIPGLTLGATLQNRNLVSCDPVSVISALSGRIFDNLVVWEEILPQIW